MTMPTINQDSPITDLYTALGHAAMRLGYAVGRLEESGELDRADRKLRAAINALHELADEPVDEEAGR